MSLWSEENNYVVSMSTNRFDHVWNPQREITPHIPWWYQLEPFLIHPRSVMIESFFHHRSTAKDIVHFSFRFVVCTPNTKTRRTRGHREPYLTLSLPFEGAQKVPTCEKRSKDISSSIFPSERHSYVDVMRWPRDGTLAGTVVGVLTEIALYPLLCPIFRFARWDGLAQYWNT